MKTIGLTGGIGTGKSTVARLLEEAGARVIHADAVGHQLYRPDSEGWRLVTEAFGPEIIAGDRTVDRKKLGAIVFRDPEALRRLNAILHPLLFTEIRNRIDLQRQAGFRLPIVVEAAVLIEARWLPLVDEVWLVVAGRQAVVERVQLERGLSAEAIEARIGAQLSDAERRPYAHVIIENTGSMHDLRQRVRAEWARLTAGEP